MPHDLTHRYLYGPAVDQILADEYDDGTTHDVYWALTDHQGSVRDVVELAGATATVANHIQYDSFGNITAESNPAVDFRFTYTGRELDEATGLYYYRARYYDANTGRFISEDPIAFESNDTNLYRYVANTPMTSTDPSGLCWSGINSSYSSNYSSTPNYVRSVTDSTDFTTFTKNELLYTYQDLNNRKHDAYNAAGGYNDTTNWLWKKMQSILDASPSGQENKYGDFVVSTLNVGEKAVMSIGGGFYESGCRAYDFARMVRGLGNQEYMVGIEPSSAAAARDYAPEWAVVAERSYALAKSRGDGGFSGYLFAGTMGASQGVGVYDLHAGATGSYALDPSMRLPAADRTLAVLGGSARLVGTAFALKAGADILAKPGSANILSEQNISNHPISTHSYHANKHLYRELQGNPKLIKNLNTKLGEDVMKHMRSGAGKKLLNPPGTHWHHPVSNPNVVQLMKKSTHQAANLQRALHPFPNRGGGMLRNFPGKR